MITCQKPGPNSRQLALFLAYAIPSSGTANAATYTVITDEDSNVGSLRQAILDANANPGPDNIDFNILGSCPRSIILKSGLPSITSPVDLNGYTQSGAAAATSGSPATLCVEINGESI